MDSTTLKISLAGLMHDIGKFTDRDLLEVDKSYILKNQDLYCKKFDNNFSHWHGLWTAAFIEKMRDCLPDELNHPGWGQEDSFINLAAMHHKPETPLQQIVTEADRLSSGMDRDSFEKKGSGTHWRQYRQIRLFPLLEQLRLPKSAAAPSRDNAAWRYPLCRVSHDTIFPHARKDVEPAGDDAAKEEYRQLFDEFRLGLQNLRHRHEKIDLWYEHFDSLLMLYTANMPAARTGDVIPDVSLYDHARSTAALATAMYLYHRDNKSLETAAAKDETPEKFLLVSGDFYGIQDFIFSTHGGTRKFRSKLLRGRSFTVSLFTELAADMLCREIGLPCTSVILNAGGKFTILAPNTPEAHVAVQRVENEVNSWLVNMSYGQNSLGLSTLTASPHDFKDGNFDNLWNKLSRKTAGRKFSRVDLDAHGGAFENYLDSFRNTLSQPLCPLCGKRPSEERIMTSKYIRMDEQDEDASSCAVCRDQVFMGTNLVKKARLAVVAPSALPPDPEHGLFNPIFDRYQILFDTAGNDLRIKPEDILRYWDLAYPFGDGNVPEVAARFINGYVPRFGEDEDLEKYKDLDEPAEPGDPKTFSHIAAAARTVREIDGPIDGVPALGVLKADVDNLGQLMAFGLKGISFNISRKATLSRQLNFFFTVYLPHRLKTDEKYHDVYTVFAGGDDLFLIGPWNCMIDLADDLDTAFRTFACQNPDVHFSAGITLHKPGTPIDTMAAAAEEALETAKHDGRERMTIFGETVTFADYRKLLKIRKDLREWLDTEKITRGMLYRLNELIEMAGMEKRLTSPGGAMKVEDMACTRWRSLLAYSVERNAGKSLKGDERAGTLLQMREELAKWITTHGSALKIPLWNILYSIRRS